MVDVSHKAVTAREAVAEGRLAVSREVIAAIRGHAVKKGDVLAVARIAGIMAVKNTSRTIPLCHDIPIDGCAIDFVLEATAVLARCSVVCAARTGAEMEALCGTATALLTVYDMCKAIDKGMVLEDVRLVSKSGGKSGDWRAEGAES